MRRLGFALKIITQSISVPPGHPQPSLLMQRWVTLLILLHVVRDAGAQEMEQLNSGPNSGHLCGSRQVTSLPGSCSCHLQSRNLDLVNTSPFPEVLYICNMIKKIKYA